MGMDDRPLLGRGRAHRRTRGGVQSVCRCSDRVAVGALSWGPCRAPTDGSHQAGNLTRVKIPCLLSVRYLPLVGLLLVLLQILGDRLTNQVRHLHQRAGLLPLSHRQLGKGLLVSCGHAAGDSGHFDGRVDRV